MIIRIIFALTAIKEKNLESEIETNYIPHL